jgi:hypothetical protein
MGLNWNDVDATLIGLRDFVRKTDLPYGIAHDFEVDRGFLDRLRSRVSAD